jgi:hypothetical protein
MNKMYPWRILLRFPKTEGAFNMTAPQPTQRPIIPSILKNTAAFKPSKGRYKGFHVPVLHLARVCQAGYGFVKRVRMIPGSVHLSMPRLSQHACLFSPLPGPGTAL